MRLGLAAAVAFVCLSACGPAAAQAPPSPTHAAPPVAASRTSLDPYFGSYALDNGDIVLVARLGWFFDMRDAAYRTIYATRSPNRFTIGPRFEVPVPKFAELLFGASTLKITEATRVRTGRRIAYKSTEVAIPSGDARLAATITEPLGAGPHPGIVIIHGSEPGERFFYDVWVGLYASLGLAVLTYDKRGNGSSTGRYPGEFPTDSALQTYADDAAAARQFLAAWPGIGPKRVGFHGGSQGGWTVPLAMYRHPGAAFAILVSAPATTVGQTDLWAGFSGHGDRLPTETTDQMLAAVRANHAGYDPPAGAASTRRSGAVAARRQRSQRAHGGLRRDPRLALQGKLHRAAAADGPRFAGQPDRPQRGRFSVAGSRTGAGAYDQSLDIAGLGVLSQQFASVAR